MTDETGLPALVLHAARDIGSVGSAFDAELLLSTLLGSIYSGVEPDRGDALDSFVDAFRSYLDSGVEAGQAPLVNAVLAALSGRSVPPVAGPAWAEALGTATVTGTYAYGDRYGDQTSYVATFAYADEDLGGPEHAIVVLADHNLGVAKDIFVASPAAGMLETLRSEVATGDDEMTWFGEIAPGTLRAAATAYLACTDAAPDEPESGSFAANRALAVARLRLLPEAAEVTGAQPTSTALRDDLIAAFLESPEADLAGLADLDGAGRESCTYCLGLIVDFATARGDALRWSPAGVDAFLGSWVHERAILDAEDAALLPDALRAWIAWAGHRLALPAAALQQTLASVRAARAEFLRAHETGERQSPAARAMAQMMIDGIDMTDMSAVTEWLKTYDDKG